MKKTLFLLVVVCLLCCSCKTRQSGNTPSTQSNSSASLAKDSSSLQLVTCDTVQMFCSSSSLSQGSNKYTLPCNGYDKDCGINLEISHTKDLSIAEAKTACFNGKEIQVSYDQSYIPSSGKNDAFNRRLDCYKNSDVTVRYLNGTGQIVSYLDAENYRSTKTNFTEAELKSIAEKAIFEMMAMNDFNKYSFEYVSYQEQMDFWQVSYRRYYEGYATDDSIRIWIANSGKVMSYKAEESGKYEYVDPNITKQHIDAAVTAAETKLKESGLNQLKILPAHMLTTNSNGEVFVRMAINYTSDSDFEVREYIYVKVG